MNRLLLLALAGCVGLSACSKKEEVTAAAAPSAATAVPSASAVLPNSGKVLQIQQAGPYTYAEVETAGQKIWIAGGPIAAKQGDSVQWGDYAVMRNFHSKSLNRDFAEILFVNAWGPVGGGTAQVAPHGAVAGQAPVASQQPAVAGANQGTVKSAAAAAGYTYVEVDQGGSAIWVAAPETPVKVGDKVRWGQGSVMQNFASKSLGRSFDRIVFASQVEVVR